MADYYVSARQVEYPYNTFERHADLSHRDAARLLETLESIGEDQITDITVEESQPEVYTVGYEDTLKAVLEELSIQLNEEEA